MIEKTYISQIIMKIGTPLAKFLEEHLSMTDVNWWNNKVLSSFPEKEINKIRNLKCRDIYKLDTAALLTIFNRNLNQFVSLTKLEFYTLRNYINECQTIRVRYMHLSEAEEISDEDIARDFDTMYRLCKEIKADKTLLDDIAECRDEFILKAYMPQFAEEKEKTSEEKKEVNEMNIGETDVSEPVTISPEQGSTVVPTFMPMMPQISAAPVYFMGMQPGMMYGMMMNSFDMRR